MITQLYNFPRVKPFVLACSGGVDSMFAADFFLRGNKNFKLAYFNHGTSQANDMQKTVLKWAYDNDVKVFLGEIKREKTKQESLEEFFRNERYRWLCTLGYDIITCHHLNDAVEGYLFSALHGNPKIIKSYNVVNYGGNAAVVYRPFLINTKQQLTDWCLRHKVEWCEDVSNADINYPRNRIRHRIINEALKINPGLFKVIKKKILKESKAHKI